MSTLQTTTSSTRNSLSPEVGDTYFETDTKNIIVYDGTNWRGYQYDFGRNYSQTSVSMSFDGADDYLQSSSDISLPSDFSLSFWIKPTNTNDCLFGKLNDNSAYISSNSSGNIQINGAVSTVGITTGEWNHILLSRSSSTITIYKKSATSNSSGTVTKSGTLTYNIIGKYSSQFSGGGAGFEHLGLIDEVAFFSSALSSTDATNIYNSGAPGDLSSYSTLTNWWRLGETISGSTIPDYEGSNDLTVYGAVTSSDVPS